MPHLNLVPSVQHLSSWVLLGGYSPLQNVRYGTVLEIFFYNSSSPFILVMLKIDENIYLLLVVYIKFYWVWVICVKRF